MHGVAASSLAAVASPALPNFDDQICRDPRAQACGLRHECASLEPHRAQDDAQWHDWLTDGRVWLTSGTRWGSSSPVDQGDLVGTRQASRGCGQPTPSRVAARRRRRASTTDVECLRH